MAMALVKGAFEVPVGASVSHVHPSEDLLNRLGIDELTILRMLTQPNQFACNERVEIGWTRENDNRTTWIPTRLLGPCRKETQVEVSKTDARKLGIAPPVRVSGDLEDTPGVLVRFGSRIISLKKGVIVPVRHLHLSLNFARILKVVDGDTVDIIVTSEERGKATLHDVLVRAGEEHETELHLDTDEVNALGF